jgi:hypothetical protein
MTFARLSLVALLLGGCSYQSQYVAPVDGRARALWHGDGVDNNLHEVQRAPACDEWVRRAQYPELQPQELRVDIAPKIWVPPPRLAIVVPPSLPPPPSHANLSFPGGGGGSSGNLGKEILAVLMVVAIVLSPIIDVTLAAARPESDKLSADNIDQVNVYNDLARTAGNPCAPY